MKKLLVGLAMVSVISISHAVEWAHITMAKTGTSVDVLRGSGVITTDSDNNSIYVGVVRYTSQNNVIEYYREYVYTDDCAMGVGVLQSLNMRGTPAGSNNYVLGGSAVGDSIAQVFCLAYKFTKNSQPSR